MLTSELGRANNAAVAGLPEMAYSKVMTTAAAAESHTSLRALLAEGANRDRIASFLDGLSPAERNEEVLALRGREVKRLYEACAGGPTLTLEDFVPASAGDDKPVIFEGRNSLPTFSRFQKRFARMGDQIVGYNHQTMAFVTGPGFFVVKPASAEGDVPGELYFDYTDKPRVIPSGWPTFKPNESGLSALVYAHMKDYMRSVAKGIVVGTAYKKGKSQNAFFVLAVQA
jgi:hypothetical protein